MGLFSRKVKENPIEPPPAINVVRSSAEVSSSGVLSNVNKLYKAYENLPLDMPWSFMTMWN